LISSDNDVDDLTALIMADRDMSTDMSDKEPGTDTSEDEDQASIVHLRFCVHFNHH
jgi:hypothetical protein